MHVRLSVLLHLCVYGSFLFVLAAPHTTILDFIILALLVWISTVDFEHYIIPDLASGSLACVGLVAVWLMPYHIQGEHIVAGIFWVVCFWGLSWIFERRYGFTGLGMGDVKLMGGVGFLLGFELTTLVVLSAALSGICFALALRFIRQTPLLGDLQTAIPFGPFLCLPAWVIWVSKDML